MAGVGAVRRETLREGESGVMLIDADALLERRMPGMRKDVYSEHKYLVFLGD